MYKNFLSDNISKKSLSSQSHKEYHLHFLVESISFIVTGLTYRFMIHIELIFVYNVRNKNGGDPPSPQIPSQLCQYCLTVSSWAPERPLSGELWRLSWVQKQRKAFFD